MPYGDGTGPVGQGRMGGRRGRGGRGGYGRGRFGGGPGWGRTFWDDVPPAGRYPADARQTEIEWLEAQANRLQEALQRINARLEMLKKEQT